LALRLHSINFGAPLQMAVAAIIEFASLSLDFEDLGNDGSETIGVIAESAIA
jgi:hypothetical protein